MKYELTGWVDGKRVKFLVNAPNGTSKFDISLFIFRKYSGYDVSIDSNSFIEVFDEEFV